LALRWTSRLGSLIWLVPLVAASWGIAYLVRFDGAIPQPFRPQLWGLLPAIVAIKMAAFWATGLSKSCHAFVSLPDCFRLFRGTAAAALGVAAMSALALPTPSIPRGVIVIDACLTAILVGGTLSLRRRRRERRAQTPAASNRTAVLLLGQPTGIELILRSLRCPPSDSRYVPTGILTDAKNMQHRAIAGVPVLGTLADAESCIKRTGCQMLMLSGGDLAGFQVRRLMEIGRHSAVDVRVVPDVGKLVSGHIEFKPRQVAIEDLLGRPPVQIDRAALRRWIAGRRVLVTGSAGSIGSELVRQLLELEPASLVLVDRSENGQFHLGRELQTAIDRAAARLVIADVTDETRMRGLFEEERPEVVFHAAAYKHVPLMEQHPGEGVKNIIGATKLLADLAHQCGVDTFVMISTDKAVRPTSVMGCCKRAAELYVQSMSAHSPCKFVTVRFGNVLGSAGSVIPVFREQIARGGPVTVTHPEMTRYFMTIPEASQLVIQAAGMGQGGEVFVLDMGAPVRILDLAEDMIRLSGLKVGHDIEIEFTGLRPGEKLSEELYGHGETPRRTAHSKILVAECNHSEPFVTMRQVRALVELSCAGEGVIRHQLNQIVPGFLPQAAAEMQPREFPRAA
jgi:FlaA1/EpsC-like NDP-sugar epimerase